MKNYRGKQYSHCPPDGDCPLLWKICHNKKMYLICVMLLEFLITLYYLAPKAIIVLSRDMFYDCKKNQYYTSDWTVAFFD